MNPHPRGVDVGHRQCQPLAQAQAQAIQGEEEHPVAQHSPGCEAGPTGFGLQRSLEAKGFACDVIAPSQIPKRASDRIKTDGRDCLQLAERSWAGQPSAAWIPDPQAKGAGCPSFGALRTSSRLVVFNSKPKHRDEHEFSMSNGH